MADDFFSFVAWTNGVISENFLICAMCNNLDCYSSCCCSFNSPEKESNSGSGWRWGRRYQWAPSSGCRGQIWWWTKNCGHGSTRVRWLICMKENLYIGIDYFGWVEGGGRGDTTFAPTPIPSPPSPGHLALHFLTKVSNLKAEYYIL